MRIIQKELINNDYLKDESQLIGKADTLYFPHTNNDISEIIKSSTFTKQPITIQGGLTGICGGGVPQGGTIINLSELNKIIGLRYESRTDNYIIKVQAGILLEDLNHQLLSRKFDVSNWSKSDIDIYNKFSKDSIKMLPNDTTETRASLGGMVSCDASGATSYYYGSIRNYVVGIKLITSEKTITIKRGQYKYKDLYKLFNTTSDVLPSWREQTNKLKDVTGLFYEDNMDLIDLFIGSEGIFGIITEIELLLINTPKHKLGIMLFINKNDKLTEYVEWLEKSFKVDYSPVAIEYFDHKSLQLLNKFREVNSNIQMLPVINSSYSGAVYLEFHLETESAVDLVLDTLASQMVKYHVNEYEQWLGIEPNDFMKLKLIRHAVPECVNMVIASKKLVDKRIRKVGTDMSVPKEYLKDVIELYEEDLRKHNFDSVIFGHIGDAHLHVNIIPRSYSEFVTAKKLLKKWAIQVTNMNGSISAEHGIGKLKKDLFHIMVNQKDIIEMIKLKKIIEPHGFINQGTMLD